MKIDDKSLFDLIKKYKKYFYFILLGLIFILAVALRLKAYVSARILFHDECTLAGNILSRNLFTLLHALGDEQKAPAGFMILNKLVSYFGGVSILSLKFIPMLGGILSVIMFYFLSNQLLKNKFSILMANFLFAINYQLIYWSQKFKPYSFDVFLFSGSILLFIMLDLDKIGYKKCLLYSILSIVLVLTSFPCAFVICGYIMYCLLSRINIKKVICYSFPLAIGLIIYYIKVLYHVQTREVHQYLSYWDAGFLKLNILSPLLIFRENFNFFFVPNKFVLMGLILALWGLVLLVKNRNKSSGIILGSLVGILFVSFLQIYPIWQRTALYLLPILILFISKPLDIISERKKIISFIIILLFIVCFSKYNLSYINSFFSPNVFSQTDGLTLFPKLVEQYDNNKDILVINSTTEADFKYYSRIYHFTPHRYILVPIYRYDKDYYYDFMNTLPKGYNYWFIFGWEYSHRKKDLDHCISHHLETYIKQNHLKVLQKYDDGNTVLIKVIK